MTHKMNTSLTTPCIWVIDDDQSIRWVLEKALSKADYNVITFESASSALSQLKKQDITKPDTILTDVRMPGLDGFKFMQQVHHINAYLPVIIMTAYADLDTTIHAYQEGAFEYLTKPFDINDVTRLVSSAVSHHFEQLKGTTDIDNSQALQLLAQQKEWTELLSEWAAERLNKGDTDLLSVAHPMFERVLLECSLKATDGRKIKAAKLMGWGRNTLTRKLKELYPNN